MIDVINMYNDRSKYKPLLKLRYHNRNSPSLNNFSPSTIMSNYYNPYNPYKSIRLVSRLLSGKRSITVFSSISIIAIRISKQRALSSAKPGNKRRTPKTGPSCWIMLSLRLLGLNVLLIRRASNASTITS